MQSEPLRDPVNVCCDRYQLRSLTPVEVPTPVEFKERNLFQQLLFEPIPVCYSARARLQETHTLVENMAKHTGFAGSHGWNSRHISTKYATIQTTGRRVTIPFFVSQDKFTRAASGAVAVKDSALRLRPDSQMAPGSVDILNTRPHASAASHDPSRLQGRAYQFHPLVNGPVLLVISPAGVFIVLKYRHDMSDESVPPYG